MTTILYQDERIRLVQQPNEVVTEVRAGEDAMGQPRWSRARLVREDEPAHLEVLSGWKEICAALGISKPHTAIAYARLQVHPLPIWYDVKGSPTTYKLLLQAWVSFRRIRRQSACHAKTVGEIRQKKRVDRHTRASTRSNKSLTNS